MQLRIPTRSAAVLEQPRVVGCDPLQQGLDGPRHAVRVPGQQLSGHEVVSTARTLRRSGGDEPLAA